MWLLRRPISASDRIPDKFYVSSMEFLSLSRRRSSAWNVPSSGERGETDVFAGYHFSYNEVLSFNFMLIFTATIVSTKQPITASPKPPIQSEFQFRVMGTTYSFRNSSLKIRSISKTQTNAWLFRNPCVSCVPFCHPPCCLSKIFVEHALHVAKIQFRT